MSLRLNENEIGCFAIDEDTAVIRIKNQNYVLDYSTLMDFLMNLAVVSSQVENAMGLEKKMANRH